MEDYSWTYELVFLTLLEARSLEELSLTYRFSWSLRMVDFPRHTNIRHIYFAWYPPGPGSASHNAIVHTMSNLIAQSPKLEKLTIQRYNPGSSISLHDLLSQCPLDILSRLEALDLTGVDIPLDQSIVQHLHSLRKLSLKQLSQIHGARIALHCLETIQNAGAPLESLSLDYLDEAIIGCIAAMRCLKELSYVSSQRKDQHAEMLSRLFMEKVLERHAPSLERLFIYGGDTFFCCIDEHNVGAVLVCQNLVTLGVTVQFQDVVDGKLNVSQHVF